MSWNLRTAQALEESWHRAFLVLKCQMMLSSCNSSRLLPQAFSLLAPFPLPGQSLRGPLTVVCSGHLLWLATCDQHLVCPRFRPLCCNQTLGQGGHEGPKDSLLIGTSPSLALIRFILQSQNRLRCYLAELWRSPSLRSVGCQLYDMCTTPLVLS